MRMKYGVCAGLLLTMLCTMPVSAADVKICGEDEVVGISNGETTEYFDYDGKYLGTIPTNMDLLEIGKEKKNSLQTAIEDHKTVIYEVGDSVRRVGVLPESGGVAWVTEGYYAWGSAADQEIRVYNTDGTCIFTTPALIDADQYSAARSAKLRHTEQGVYLVYTDAEWDDFGMGFTALSISADGENVTNLYEGYLIEEWGDYVLPDTDTIGEYLFCDGTVLDFDGDMILNDGILIMDPSSIYEWSGTPGAVLQQGADENGNPQYCLCDKNMTLTNTYPAAGDLAQKVQDYLGDGWPKDLRSDGNFLVGAPAPELNGYACTGFTAYGGPDYSIVVEFTDNVDGWVPSAATDGGTWVYVNGETRFLPLRGSEKLVAVNDYLYLAKGESDDGYPYQKVQRMDNGEELLRIYSYYASLEKSCVCGYLTNDYEKGYNVVDIDPETYELTYRRMPGWSVPWSDDLMVATRSIYRGIVDKYGNWIVRIIEGGMD
ncbi:MAG: hypothetical protein KBT01_00340 [Clostridiales bacterium]|nr:hypothetical protein [Candidatus Blautia equi]